MTDYFLIYVFGFGTGFFVALWLLMVFNFAVEVSGR